MKWARDVVKRMPKVCYFHRS